MLTAKENKIILKNICLEQHAFIPQFMVFFYCVKVKQQFLHF